MLTRRGFLSSTALASLGLAAGVPAARALSIEEGAADLAAQYHAARAAACAASADSYHARVLADVRALLEGRELSDDERRQALAQATCPLCGCPVAGS